MVTICFDFDGVLAAYDEWRDGAIGEPIPEGLILANACRAMGYKIVIQTCRTHREHAPSNDYQLRDIRKWLHDNKVPFDHIDIHGKPTADVYIDDRGLYFDQHMGINMKGYGAYMMAVIAERVESRNTHEVWSKEKS